MKIHLFNPDSERAYGIDRENYIAPASVRRMEQDLALLPIWYASPGSGVLAPSAYNADYLKQMQQLFSLPVQLVTEPELRDYPDAQIVPWGWNPALKERLLKAGASEQRLPDIIDLFIRRIMFSRDCILELYKIFKSHPNLKYLCGHTIRLQGSGEESITDEALKAFGNAYLFKSLWSSSGRGLHWCRKGLTKATLDWCRSEMKKFGGVMVEPIYDKEADFAMEFYSDGKGKALFVGYSRFVTNENGAYCGNILMSDEEVERWMQQYIPLEIFISIREWMQRAVGEVYCRAYTGYFGVDMMVCRNKRGLPYNIHPLVEVNLRMNMGVVSHTLYNNFVASGSVGRFSVDNFRSNEALRTQHEKDMSDYPLVVEKGRVVSGYLSLVPITPKSLFRAYMIVERASKSL